MTSHKEVWHRLDEHGMLIWLGQASRVQPDPDYFDWDGALSVTIRKFSMPKSATGSLRSGSRPHPWLEDGQ